MNKNNLLRLHNYSKIGNTVVERPAKNAVLLRKTA